MRLRILLGTCGHPLSPIPSWDHLIPLLSHHIFCGSVPLLPNTATALVPASPHFSLKPRGGRLVLEAPLELAGPSLALVAPYYLLTDPLSVFTCPVLRLGVERQTHHSLLMMARAEKSSLCFVRNGISLPCQTIMTLVGGACKCCGPALQLASQQTSHANRGAFSCFKSQLAHQADWNEALPARPAEPFPSPFLLPLLHCLPPDVPLAHRLLSVPRVCWGLCPGFLLLAGQHFAS